MSGKFYKREELIGKTVINQEARIVGKVEDLAITVEGEVGISVKGEDGEDIMLKLDEIKKIGDVILLVSEDEIKPGIDPTLKESTRMPSQEKICPKCGWENRPDTNYCVKCGAKLG